MMDSKAANLYYVSQRVKSRYFKDLDYGQTRQILEILLEKTREYIEKNILQTSPHAILDDSAVETAEQYYTLACEFVDDLRTVLNPLGRGERFPKNPTYIFTDFDLESRLALKKAGPEEIKENKEDYSYEKRKRSGHWISHLDNGSQEYVSYNDLFMDGWDSVHYWPVGDLGPVVNNYTKYHWLQCYAVDRIIIRSFIYKAILEYSEAVSNTIFPPSKSLFFSYKQKTYRTKLKKSENWFMLRSTAYMIFSLILAAAAANSTNWWTGVIVWLFVSAQFTILDYLSVRDKNKKSEKLLAKLEKVRGLLGATNQSGLTPSFIKSRLIDVDSYGLRFPANLYLILDLAEQRSGIYWSFGD
jgi:hypothetical protein